MNVYLVQTSGADIEEAADPAYVRAAAGPRFCDEPLDHHRYFNAEPFWEHGFQRRRAWQTVDSGDVVLLYCTGSVGEFPRSLSHICRVDEKRIVAGEGAWLEFAEMIELASPIAYVTLQRQLERGGFSEGMGRLGQEGFNFRQVRSMDLGTVMDLSPPSTGTWDERL